LYISTEFNRKGINMNKLQFSLVAGLSAIGASALAADVPEAAAPVAPAAATRVPAAKGPSLELAVEAARIAIETCAAAGGQKIGASVVDSAGVLKVLLAADGTSPRGVTSSTAKAVTALNFKVATSQLTEQIKTDKELADKIAANTSFNARPGGVLLKVGDEIIGAVGVGGGRTDADCAIAGVQKIQDRLK
jgi:uncharacterized protein GlcG (DUF336 family)